MLNGATIRSTIHRMCIARTLRVGGALHHKSSFSKSEELYSGWWVLLQVVSPAICWQKGGTGIWPEIKRHLRHRWPHHGEFVFVLCVGFICVRVSQNQRNYHKRISTEPKIDDESRNEIYFKNLAESPKRVNDTIMPKTIQCAFCADSSKRRGLLKKHPTINARLNASRRNAQKQTLIHCNTPQKITAQQNT